MCRFLAVRDDHPVAMTPWLEGLAGVARRSREFQGDGWGCAWWEGGAWQTYHTLRPIWEDALDRFGAASVFLAHARSAFRNEGIAVEHNMPFIDGAAAFVFNGELQGVRITEQGRIGAEKLFRFLRRLGADESLAAMRRTVDIVVRRTRYVRAMNFVLATGPVFRVGTRFGEDPGYFTLHQARRGEQVLIASEPVDDGPGWEPLPNGTLLELR